MTPEPDPLRFVCAADWSPEEALRLLLQSVPAELWLADDHGRILLASRALENSCGVEEGHLAGSQVAERLRVRTKVHEEQEHQGSAAEGPSERPVITVNGQSAVARAGARWSRPGGERGWTGAALDLTPAWDQIISERIAQDAATQQQISSSDNASALLLFEKNPQPMWVYDLETLRFLAVNEAAIQNYGYSREEFLALTLEDIRPPEEIDKLREDVATTTQELNYAGQWLHRTKSGELRNVEIRSHAVDWNGCKSRLVVVYDITEQKRATEELDRFFNLSQDLLCIGTREGCFLRLNPQWSRVLGYELDQLIGHNVAEFIHPEDLLSTLRVAQQMGDDGELQDFTNRFRCRDGSYRVLEWRAHSLGRYIYSVARDVTDKRQAEERLRDLSRAIEQSPASVVITDTEGRIEYVNPKFEALTGYSLEEVVGRNPNLLKSGRTSKEEYRELWRTISAGEVWEGEFENRKKDGTIYQERASISPVRDEQGRIRHFVAVKEDITEERTLQLQLLQAQKMEAVGLLAGGIAHDFNNLLTVINGYSQIALGEPDLPEKAREHISTVLDAGERAARMTRQLLLFGRKQPGITVALDMNPLVADLGDFYRRVLPENVHLEIVPSPEPAIVMADPTLLQQVVMNLVLNARDAMPGGGRVRLGISRVEINGRGAYHPLDGAATAPEVCVLLEVEDSGVGMSDEVQQHLFEPFYSTKPHGQGSGLGLATAFGIVKQAGGWIRVTSAPGEGSKFSVYLPAMQAGVSPGAPEDQKAMAEKPLAGKGRILLVEDAASVRRFVSDALSELGYTVRSAGTGEEALAIARQKSDSFDLLITDVLLPGMDGMRTAAAVREISPGMAVLLVSGYIPPQAESAPLAQESTHFLAKPFTIEALGTAVRKALLSMRGLTQPE